MKEGGGGGGALEAGVAGEAVADRHEQQVELLPPVSVAVPDLVRNCPIPCADRQRYVPSTHATWERMSQKQIAGTQVQAVEFATMLSPFECNQYGTLAYFQVTQRSRLPD